RALPSFPTRRSSDLDRSVHFPHRCRGARRANLDRGESRRRRDLPLYPSPRCGGGGGGERAMSDIQVVHAVDDDAAVRDSLSFMLAAADLTVRTYDSAGALLARFDELEP